jgi:hypothetical protein
LNWLLRWDELGDARQVEGVEPLEPDLHGERGQIVVDVGEVGLGQLALSFLAVLVGPLRRRTRSRTD